MIGELVTGYVFKDTTNRTNVIIRLARGQKIFKALPEKDVVLTRPYVSLMVPF